MLRKREQELLAAFVKAPKSGEAIRVGRFAVAAAALALVASCLVSNPPTTARLSAANLENEDIQATRFDHALLTGANLRQTNLTGSWLQGTDLTYATLFGASLKSVYAPDAVFYCAVAEAADLRDIVAPRADFRRASLRSADLRGARLTWARFEGADLRDAKLGDADLTGATYDDATLWPASQPPPRLGTRRSHQIYARGCTDEAAKRATFPF